MLKNCFLHIKGVGPALVGKLHRAGIKTWHDAVNLELPCNGKEAALLLGGINDSELRLQAQDAFWFSQRLKAAEQWRLFSHFKHSAAYVDIETTGLDAGYSYITSIALYDGKNVRTYVRGKNIEAFADDILAYKLLVTWNGRCFDAPFIRRELAIPLDKQDMGHLDLLPVFRSLGLRGGLKKVEQKLNLARGDLAGLDGLAAIILWEEYARTGKASALETLLAYNVADVLSLEVLAEYAFSSLSSQGSACAIQPQKIKNDLNPYKPDLSLLRHLHLL